jgi:hypothetical protein
MMLKRATAIFSLSYLLLHATLGESNQTSSLHFKSTNTRYSLHLLISLTYKLSNSYLSNFTKIQKLSDFCISLHHSTSHPTMSFNATTNLSNDSTPIITSEEQSSSFSPHANTTTIPLNVDPVTIVFPNEEEQHSPVTHKVKSKKKKNSKSAAVRKTLKLKRGESKTSLSMEELYLKKIPLNADANDESFVKDSKAADVEASKNNPTTHSEKASDATEKTKDFEKGNSEKTLKTADDKIAENLRVDDKICDDTATCKMTESMASKGADNTDISKTVEIPFEKQDVGPDVGTSLDQQVDQGNMADDTVEPDAEVQGKDSSNNDGILVTNKNKKDATKSQEVVDDSDSE